MSADRGGLVHEKTEFDDWRSLTIGVYMALVGYAVMVGQPVISSAWVDYFSFSEVQVGRVAGADLFGLGVGAAIAAILVAKVDRRYLAVFAAALAVGTTLLCTVYQSYGAMLVLRLFAGIGAGIFTGIAVATIAGHSRPALAFGIELFAFAGSQGAELYFFPSMTINEIYWVLAGTFVIGVLFISWLPRRPAQRASGADVAIASDADRNIKIPRYVPWLVLLAIVLTYINIGAYWTYAELAALDAQVAEDWVESVLWKTSVFSVIGCLFAVLLSNRFGLAKPLFVSLIVQGGIVVMLVTGINSVNIAVSMFMFNFCWIFVDIYQAATIANVDRSGRFPALIPAAQGIGYFVGPNTAASILGFGFGYNGVFLLCGAASIGGMLVYLYMYLALRRKIPALADAS